MTVGFKVKQYWYEVGEGSFLHSFFSTVCYHLEDSRWGSKFPYIMNKLYYKKLNRRDIAKAIKELEDIKDGLKNFSPNQVIWNIENLELKPPWGNNITEEITSLENYYVTSNGKDFFSVFEEALLKAQELRTDITIE